MKLFSFLQSLLTEGSVTVEGQLSAFEDEDLIDSIELLKQFYEEDVIQVPGIAPAFSADAAIWASKHVYLSLQLIVLRDIDEETINTTLKVFNGEISPSTIYSADLVLRHLAAVFELAKGLAPSDIMVKKMMDTGVQWPYSSVGMSLQQQLDDTIILSHLSLRISYTDRIIKSKDIKRISNNNIKESIMEALGNYAPVLWPEFDEQISSNTSCIQITTTLL